MESPISEYMLLFRGTDWGKDLSPQEIQNVMGQFNHWMERLSQHGKLKVGQPLAPKGKVVSGKTSRTVADGPFAESKEAIGGYWLLKVEDFDEAVKIAEECPLLNYGSSIEVRPVLEKCAHMQWFDEHPAEVSALTYEQVSG